MRLRTSGGRFTGERGSTDAGRSNVPRDAAAARAVEHAAPERIVEVSVALAIDAHVRKAVAAQVELHTQDRLLAAREHQYLDVAVGILAFAELRQQQRALEQDLAIVAQSDGGRRLAGRAEQHIQVLDR